MPGLSREQLSKFLPNHAAVDKFEQLFKLLDIDFSTIGGSGDTSQESSDAYAQASEALSQLAIVADKLAAALVAPIQQPIAQVDSFLPTLDSKIETDSFLPVASNRVEVEYFAPVQQVTKQDINLGNVENTALSTWAGSTNIVTLGDITTGKLHGSEILQTSAIVLSAGTLDLYMDNRFVGFVAVSSVLSASASFRTQTTYSTMIFDGDADSIQQIHTANGSGGGSTFTLTFINGTGFRVTNTSGGTRTLSIAIFGTFQS